jgi:hypothetical protein
VRGSDPFNQWFLDPALGDVAANGEAVRAGDDWGTQEKSAAGSNRRGRLLA